jgi:pyridinium-3,5-bisthiocarboxylic acid mononucleotide nickel chelatase
VVGVSAGLEDLGLDELVVSPVAVGSGRVHGAHGEMAVPPPAVVELLRGVPSYAGPGDRELCTPTGAALLTSSATSYGPQPLMSVDRVGVGAGGRDPVTHANVLRLLVGEKAVSLRDASSGRGGNPAPLLLECNVDDLDPRVWPSVIAALLEAGASDAWLTPILMKKGRPAHTLSVLVAADRADAVRTVVFRHTSTIGLREQTIGKTTLDRAMETVEVDGFPVHVKIAVHKGRVVNAQPEYDDVARAAAATGRPVKEVLADAIAASRALVDGVPDS